MAQAPLNIAGGEAVQVRLRMPDGDVARVIRLAARRRLSRSAVMRELLAFALDRLEADAAAAGNGEMTVKISGK